MGFTDLASQTRYPAGLLGRVLLGNVLLASALVLAGGAAQAADQRTATVGMPARIEQLVLPGGPLEAAPRTDARDPIVLRVAGVFPHGDSHRYDLVYYGLEPGEYDLAKYLKRKDGAAADLPPIKVTVKPVLAAGQVLPTTLENQQTPFLGGYRLWWALGIVLWVAGFFAILLVGRRRRSADGGPDAAPLTLADRLRPAVQAAIEGELPSNKLAELERLLVAYWRRRLKLQDVKASAAIPALREHEEAGALLRQLESWLHQPDRREPVDVAALLKPYQQLPADALDGS